jgi:acyl dehydratase
VGGVSTAVVGDVVTAGVGDALALGFFFPFASAPGAQNPTTAQTTAIATIQLRDFFRPRTGSYILPGHRGEAMAKQIINGSAELKALVGKEFTPGEWKTLKFEDIMLFADATGDHQWIHVDRERAIKESPYGAPIAHGYYSVSRIAGLFMEMVEFKGFAMAINYGLNKVRFPTPLKEGAVYRLKMALDSVNEVPNGIETIFKATMEIQGEAKPCMAAEVVFRYFG